MPDTPEAATWPSLLDEKRSALGISEAGDTITNESEFRDAFEEFCDQHGETHHQRQLASLSLQFRYITAFTRAIDSSSPNLKAPGNLTSLFWAAAFAITHAALQADVALADFVKLLKPLNKAIPNLGADLTRYPQDDNVQNPLRRIFSQYLGCYEEMISYFASSPPPLEFEPIRSSFDNANAIIQEAKLKWEQALKAAAKHEERERLLTSSVPASLPNDLNGQVMQPYPVNVHFEVIRHLGDGTYGRVSEVRESSTRQVYARKLISAQQGSRLRTFTEGRVIEEVSIMHKLRHHHIASCLFWTRDSDYFSIVMLPVAEYDLRRFLETECVQKNFPRSAVTQLDNWFGCLVSALTYAHNQSVEHKDIKLSNILIKNEQPYLADFGSATDFSELEASTQADNILAGTPVYYAPEPRPWGRSADVFALGCVFSEMLTVRYGKNLNEYRDYRHVENLENGYAFRANLPSVREWLEALGDGGDDEALQLVTEQTLKMMEEDTARRPEAWRVKRRLRTQADTLFCNSC